MVSSRFRSSAITSAISSKLSFCFFSKFNVSLANSTSFDITQITPGGWLIFIFSQSELKPNQCAGVDCVCICDEVWTHKTFAPDRQINECTKKGVCYVVSPLIESDNIEILKAGGTSIQIYKENNWIGVREI